MFGNLITAWHLTHSQAPPAPSGRGLYRVYTQGAGILRTISEFSLPHLLSFSANLCRWPHPTPDEESLCLLFREVHHYNIILRFSARTITGMSWALSVPSSMHKGVYLSRPTTLDCIPFLQYHYPVTTGSCHSFTSSFIIVLSSRHVWFLCTKLFCVSET